MINYQEILPNQWKITFNGIDISPFFYVKSTTGRGVMSREVNTATIGNRPGGFFRGTRLPVRTITIDVLFAFSSEEELKKKQEELTYILHTDEPQPLVFHDEPDRTYYAIFESVSEGEEKDGFQSATLTFICPDPYKYGEDSAQELSVLGEDSNFVEGGDFAGGQRSSGWTSDGTIVPIDDLPGFDYALEVTEPNRYPAYHFYERSDSLRGKKINISMYVKYKNAKYNGTKGNSFYMRARYKADQSLHYFSDDFKIGIDGIPTEWTRISFVADLSTMTQEIDQLYFCLNTVDFDPVDMYITGAAVTVGTDLSEWRPYSVSEVKNIGLAPVSPLVKCIFKEAASQYEIQLLNSDFTINKTVKLVFNFIAGDTLLIDFEKRKVTLNGNLIMTALQLQSDFFVLPSGNSFLKASHPSTVLFKERYL